MTCLYCGKKLGFFSRYKDTPFCSEEHLREHQTELEQALIERLGGAATKSNAPTAARPGQDTAKETEGNKPVSAAAAPNVPPSIYDFDRRSSPSKSQAPSVHDVGSFSRGAGERNPDTQYAPGSLKDPSGSKQRTAEAEERSGARNRDAGGRLNSSSLPPAIDAPTGKEHLREQRHGAPDPNSFLNLPRPLADTPVNLSSFGDNAPKRQRQEYDPGPPLAEKFFSDGPEPTADLHTDKPWMSPSTFAIIVQADCCVPSLAALHPEYAPDADDEQFEIDLDSMELRPLNLASSANSSANTVSNPIANTGEVLQPFSEDWLLLPEAGTSVEMIFGETNPFPWQDCQLPLEYEAETEAVGFSPLGHRASIPPRTPQRYPYPGSQVLSLDQNFPIAIESLPLGDGDDWDPIRLEGPVLAPLAAVVPGSADYPAWSGEPSCFEFSQEMSLAPFSALEQGLHLAKQSSLADKDDFQASMLVSSERPASAFEAVSPSTPELQLPSHGTNWQPESVFPRAIAQYRSPAINFPVLFELTPSLPPKPSIARPS